ncbi:Tetratricopeptide repeat-containing protein [Maridesulfovibrio ferrireducens]|uniref:Tetratricopeptide repeat-containing protein n=1 Tax=Maridesulfovibrio ferrireducens TaxID=246191 RepID=A0A1G9E854_9BACT|nr:HEAT repeat domain-containing protein [Maridesulfovibrio ferrireducens]SDK72300.1 Tetratricopeptide repeat-containing protein [Maridesulfovibrio ferrireducens]
MTPCIYRRLVSALWLTVLFFIPLLVVNLAHASTFAGSESCRDCHERFYKLWAPSRHGTAMQPYTPEFAAQNLTPQAASLNIEGKFYQVFIGKDAGYVIEKTDKGEIKYNIEHILGGKYVYYFLTPMEKGRLQTLPLAYDVNKKEWFDMAGSGIRHVGDTAVSWTDPVYTFNTTCHGCHVSQLRNNFDPLTNSYSTTWNEPGINCETCHGPSSEHNRVCREAPKGTVPADLKLLGGKGKFTVQQNTDACAPCHAQMIPLTGAFMPGDKFYDHFDLVTLEDPDSYPDGRDLGENYTHTTWSLSPCVKSGELGCIHCHTSSGRFRQKSAPNTACSPCHKDKVSEPEKHTMHKGTNKSPTCISCHMHKTTFARMDRSDHSMLPPTPAATIAFGSPNACNGCHMDKDAVWADKKVREWRQRDYQAPVMYRSGLVDSARKGDWSRLGEINDYIMAQDHDPIFTTSLIRLLRGCNVSEKEKPLFTALNDASPLVRSAAAEALGPPSSPEAVQALVKATGDPYRLVRIRAAAALSGLPMNITKGQFKDNLDRATQEYMASLTARPDLWTSLYNLGNYHLHRREFVQASEAFDKAHGLAPRAVPPLVNNAMALAGKGDTKSARDRLREALQLSPDNPAILFNLGLIEGELGDIKAAEKHLRASLKVDPKLAQAAYNLSLLTGKQKPLESMDFAERAYVLEVNPRYGFNLAFAQNRAGKRTSAKATLRTIIEKWPGYADAYLFILDLTDNKDEKMKIRSRISSALKSRNFSARDRALLKQALAGNG